LEPDASTIAWYAKTWGEYQLQPAAILKAVDDVMRPWESGRWPGPNVIATRALRDPELLAIGKQMYARMAKLAGVTTLSDRIARRIESRRVEFWKRPGRGMNKQKQEPEGAVNSYTRMARMGRS
jgi:hypothetical protein